MQQPKMNKVDLSAVEFSILRNAVLKLKPIDIDEIVYLSSFPDSDRAVGNYIKNVHLFNNALQEIKKGAKGAIPTESGILIYLYQLNEHLEKQVCEIVVINDAHRYLKGLGSICEVTVKRLHEMGVIVNGKINVCVNLWCEDM